MLWGVFKCVFCRLVLIKCFEIILNCVLFYLVFCLLGIKILRIVFGLKCKDLKFIVFEYVFFIGFGELEIDVFGMDCCDVMEELCMVFFRLVLEGENVVVFFERGVDVFKC